MSSTRRQLPPPNSLETHQAALAENFSDSITMDSNSAYRQLRLFELSGQHPCHYQIRPTKHQQGEHPYSPKREERCCRCTRPCLLSIPITIAFVLAFLTLPSFTAARFFQMTEIFDKMQAYSVSVGIETAMKSVEMSLAAKANAFVVAINAVGADYRDGETYDVLNGVPPFNSNGQAGADIPCNTSSSYPPGSIPGNCIIKDSIDFMLSLDGDSAADPWSNLTTSPPLGLVAPRATSPPFPRWSQWMVAAASVQSSFGLSTAEEAIITLLHQPSEVGSTDPTTRHNPLRYARTSKDAEPLAADGKLVASVRALMCFSEFNCSANATCTGLTQELLPKQYLDAILSGVIPASPPPSSLPFVRLGGFDDYRIASTGDMASSPLTSDYVFSIRDEGVSVVEGDATRLAPVLSYGDDGSPILTLATHHLSATNAALRPDTTPNRYVGSLLFSLSVNGLSSLLRRAVSSIPWGQAGDTARTQWFLVWSKAFRDGRRTEDLVVVSSYWNASNYDSTTSIFVTTRREEFQLMRWRKTCYALDGQSVTPSGYFDGNSLINMRVANAGCVPASESDYSSAFLDTPFTTPKEYRCMRRVSDVGFAPLQHVYSGASSFRADSSQAYSMDWFFAHSGVSWYDMEMYTFVSIVVEFGPSLSSNNPRVASVNSTEFGTWRVLFFIPQFGLWLFIRDSILIVILPAVVVGMFTWGALQYGLMDFATRGARWAARDDADANDLPRFQFDPQGVSHGIGVFLQDVFIAAPPQGGVSSSPSDMTRAILNTLNHQLTTNIDGKHCGKVCCVCADPSVREGGADATSLSLPPPCPGCRPQDVFTRYDWWSYRRTPLYSCIVDPMMRLFRADRNQCVYCGDPVLTRAFSEEMTAVSTTTTSESGGIPIATDDGTAPLLVHMGEGVYIKKAEYPQRSEIQQRGIDAVTPSFDREEGGFILRVDFEPFMIHFLALASRSRIHHGTAGDEAGEDRAPLKGLRTPFHKLHSELYEAILTVMRDYGLNISRGSLSGVPLDGVELEEDADEGGTTVATEPLSFLRAKLSQRAAYYKMNNLPPVKPPPSGMQASRIVGSITNTLAQRSRRFSEHRVLFEGADPTTMQLAAWMAMAAAMEIHATCERILNRHVVGFTLLPNAGSTCPARPLSADAGPAWTEAHRQSLAAAAEESMSVVLEDAPAWANSQWNSAMSLQKRKIRQGMLRRGAQTPRHSYVSDGRETTWHVGLMPAIVVTGLSGRVACSSDPPYSATYDVPAAIEITQLQQKIELHLAVTGDVAKAATHRSGSGQGVGGLVGFWLSSLVEAACIVNPAAPECVTPGLTDVRATVLYELVAPALQSRPDPLISIPSPNNSSGAHPGNSDTAASTAYPSVENTPLPPQQQQSSTTNSIQMLSFRAPSFDSILPQRTATFRGDQAFGNDSGGGSVSVGGEPGRQLLGLLSAHAAACKLMRQGKYEEAAEAFLNNAAIISSAGSTTCSGAEQQPAIVLTPVESALARHSMRLCEVCETLLEK